MTVRNATVSNGGPILFSVNGSDLQSYPAIGHCVLLFTVSGIPNDVSFVERISIRPPGASSIVLTVRKKSAGKRMLCVIGRSIGVSAF